MSRIDRVLKFICRCMGVIFTILTAFFCVGCLFGLILARHVDNTVEVLEQVRSLGFVVLICFLASFTFHCTAEFIN